MSGLNLLTRHDGELMIDHRSMDGISLEHAHQIGLDGVPLGKNTYNTVPTLGCNHCGAVVVVNPNRKRERAYCRTCDHYICHICDGVRYEADYVHRTIKDVMDAVKSGHYVLEPGPIARAKLIPTGAFNV